MNFIIYDIEIIRAIPMKGEPKIQGIEYADGFRDVENLGISVIGTYDYQTRKYHAYLEDEFGAFETLAAKRKVVSFNGILFDDLVCRAEALEIRTWYDILRETYRAIGLDPFPSHFTKAYSGYGLDAICQANKLGGKTGHGAYAPVLWQQGKRQEVIDYCLNDVKLTKELFDMILAGAEIQSPKNDAQQIIFPPVS